jgi:hypothetical protein
VTKSWLDQPETTEVWVVHRALALTLYVPGADQVLDWVPEPHPERSD